VGTVEHKFVTVNGVRLHVAEQGEGTLVLLLHGFPESRYSWRHQIAQLAAAGYRVVAPDQRGYAPSEQPEAVEVCSLLHLAGDIIGLVDALGEKSVVLVGHDWGGFVAWVTAMLRPDVVRAMAGLSVTPSLSPYQGRGQAPAQEQQLSVEAPRRPSWTARARPAHRGASEWTTIPPPRWRMQSGRR
jgi:pimeloyl-ACP methyl ester carboxylesterase